MKINYNHVHQGTHHMHVLCDDHPPPKKKWKYKINTKPKELKNWECLNTNKKKDITLIPWKKNYLPCIDFLWSLKKNSNVEYYLNELT